MYEHKVKFYETDQMGVTHHSNYMRWMEEARVDYFDKIGYSYKRIEDEGYSSPVVSINAKYKKTTTFDDLVQIDAQIIDLSPAKLTFGYTMKVNDEVVFIGESVHCFYKKNGKLISLKKEKEELYNLLNSLVIKNEE